MKDISFIVTCYNEEKNVIGAIDKVKTAAEHLKLSYEILVFDDASQDATSEVVQKYMLEHPNLPIKLYKNIENKGVAYNFVEGVFQGTGEYCRLICGDNIEPIETHIKLLSELSKAEIILPYYKQIIGRTALRHFISKTFTHIINLISGYSIKYYNGCPVFKRGDIMRWHVEATGLGYQAELIIRLLRQNKKYIEVEVDGFDREGSVSFRLRNVLSVCHSILKISLARLKVAVLK